MIARNTETDRHRNAAAHRIWENEVARRAATSQIANMAAASKRIVPAPSITSSPEFRHMGTALP